MDRKLTAFNYRKESEHFVGGSPFTSHDVTIPKGWKTMSDSRPDYKTCSLPGIYDKDPDVAEKKTEALRHAVYQKAKSQGFTGDYDQWIAAFTANSRSPMLSKKAMKWEPEVVDWMKSLVEQDIIKPMSKDYYTGPNSPWIYKTTERYYSDDAFKCGVMGIEKS